MLMQGQLKDGKTVWTVSQEMHFLATTEKNPLLLDSVGQLFLATEENPRLLDVGHLPHPPAAGVGQLFSKDKMGGQFGIQTLDNFAGNAFSGD